MNQGGCHRTWYIGLGGNMNNTREVFRTALDVLSRYAPLVACSRVYETEPQDRSDQPRFLNMVCACSWAGHPVALLAVLNHIEALAGRLRDPSDPKGPRVLDLDLVFAGTFTYGSPQLMVPHERMHQRRFVLEPLLEIMDDCIHPLTGISLSEYKKRCDGQAIYSAAVLV